MKPYCICIALLIIALSYSNAEIKNGYAPQIKAAETSLEACKSLLRDDVRLPLNKKKKIQAKLNDLIKYVAYFELTEKLLQQLQEIAPDLYYEIDHIKDSNGFITDVYVRFVPEGGTSVQAWGITGIAQVPGDENTYFSEYGERTVSIKVWAVAQALLVLSHEFGHVRYMVPNLASYKNYHVKHYRTGLTESNHVGHNSDDPSGKCALEFEKRFKASYYSQYLKRTHVGIDSPAILANRIRRQILANMDSAVSPARW